MDRFILRSQEEVLHPLTRLKSKTLSFGITGRDILTTPPPPPQPAPGWYPDPADGGQRYWDGTAWTEHHYGQATVPMTSPPKRNAAARLFKVIGFAFLGLFVLGWGLRFFLAGYTHNPEVLRNPNAAQRDHEMTVWINEKAIPIMKTGPQLWIDYANAEGLEDIREVCQRMSNTWVVDLGAILPAPIPDLNHKFQEFRDAAKTATENCISGLNESLTEERGKEIDTDFANLQRKSLELGEAMSKWASSP